MQLTGSSNDLIVMENGERVYPCPCGTTHRGPYALYDYAHHVCPHDAGLVRVVADEPDYLICPDCGKHFWIAQSEREGN